MANILILGVKVPFVGGGQEALVKSLQEELKSRGHRVDVVEMPYSPTKKEDLLKYASMWRALDFDNFCAYNVDLVIPTKFPSFFAKHSKKSLWLVHQQRSCYDLYSTRYSDISETKEDEAFRRMYVDSETKVIKECAYISGISKNVMNRLEKYNGVKGDVLYPPLVLGNKYYCKSFENYILSVGRICDIKRVEMLILSLPYIKSDIKLKIAGGFETQAYKEHIESVIALHNLSKRVEFVGRISDEELLELFANALAVYYAPYDEDYGYVTLEAFASSKPILTCTDSGGVLEFVKDKETGIITEPSPEALAEGIDYLCTNKDKAKKMGKDARESVESLDLLSKKGWDKVVEGLLSPIEGK